VAKALDAGIRLGDAVRAGHGERGRINKAEPCHPGAPDYLKRRGTARSLADLANHDGNHFRLPSCGSIFQWELVDAVEIDLAGCVTVNDSCVGRVLPVDGGLTAG
jgi:hypothetical protein